MQRDMELARGILLAVEAHGKPVGWVKLSVPDRSEEEVSYHVELLQEAGLIEAEEMSSLASYEWLPKRLTWDGHEFLDAIRNDTIWSQTKSVVAEKGGSIPFELLKELAITVARTYFGLTS